MSILYSYPTSDVAKGLSTDNFMAVVRNPGCTYTGLDQSYVWRWALTGTSNWVYDEYTLSNVAATITGYLDACINIRAKAAVASPAAEIKFGLVYEGFYVEYCAALTLTTAWQNIAVTVTGLSVEAINAANLRISMRNNSVYNAAYCSDAYLSLLEVASSSSSSSSSRAGMT